MLRIATKVNIENFSKEDVAENLHAVGDYCAEQRGVLALNRVDILQKAEVGGRSDYFEMV